MGIIRQPSGQAAPAPPATRQPQSSATLTQPPAPAADDARSELSRRRDALAEVVTELHWDLGGLTYEMAIRDHFRLDVLIRRAALLQERDAELAEVERLLRMEQDGAAGACPSCAAPHSRGALYCWQCGATLMERKPSAAIAERDGSSPVTDALFAYQSASTAEPAASSDE
jgi:hypothetical protein